MREWLISLDKSNFLDLSYPMQPGMTLLKPYYEDLEFRMANGGVPDVDETGYPLKGFYARTVNSGSDGLLEGYGTHVEASSHPFGVRGRNIDEYPLTSFIGPGVVINVADKAKKDPGYRVTVEDMLAWKRRHGEIPEGAIVVLNSGWGDRFGDYDSYFGVDDKGEYHYPGFSPEACQWLLDNYRVNAIGTDTATIDGRPAMLVPGYPEDRTPHGLAREIVMKPPNHILNIEYMANVGKLPENGALIICAPINFAGGYGGLARCFAIW